MFVFAPIPSEFPLQSLSHLLCRTHVRILTLEIKENGLIKLFKIKMIYFL
ncbi:hypothetical protein LEP1GSC170_3274 [Leptospira interrogans serovar Bataviae str. HAI135]|nr:hypothetical protein LEP1GSC170_3274 [Leptospira interrogans serovar Bataviae str. HAI135]